MSAIVAEARRWLGTPFHHQGRRMGVGVDCVGVVIGVAHALGLSQFDTTDYPRTPVGRTMMRLLREHLIPAVDPRPGDIAVFRFRRTLPPQHVGLLTDVGLLHAYEPNGQVVEHGLDAQWRERMVGAFRFPERD